MMSQSDGDRDVTQAPPMSDRITGERYGRRVALVSKRWIEGPSAYPTEYIREGAIPASAVGWVGQS